MSIDSGDRRNRKSGDIELIADGPPVPTPGAAAILARMIRQAITTREADGDSEDQPGPDLQS
jgi:hypothetical protein